MLYRALELTLAPALRVIHRPVVTGLEHVPATGAVIFAANHVSFADEIFTPLAARRQIVYFAKAEYFTSPGASGWAMKQFFEAMGHVAVARADTRSPDGRLYRFRTGVARVALRSGAPVVPVGLVGTREVQAPGERKWRRGHVEVHFGAPLTFGDRAAEERSSRVLREITETVREAVQDLSGQQYVDAFAGSAGAA